jgi:putative ABC transport system permease protein
MFTPTPAGGLLSLKVSTENLPQTIAAVERIYKTLFPGNPFNYSFVDEKFDEQYRKDRRFAALFSVFAVLAILIACLGLFGLASFSAQQRTKEIGIRKVLGASISGIIAALSRIRQTGVGNIIAGGIP